MKFSPILQPGIEFRCEALGLALPSGRGSAEWVSHPASEAFARRLNHGPWDRVVRRREEAKQQRQLEEDHAFLWRALAIPSQSATLIDIGNWGFY